MSRHTPSATPDDQDQGSAGCCAAAFWAMLEARLGQGRQPLYRAMVYVIVLALAASLSMVAVVGYFAEQQAARNDRLTREISSLDRQLNELREVKSALQIHLLRMQTIAQLQRQRSFPALDLSAVSRALPQGVRLSELIVDGDIVVLRGDAQSAARVASLIRNLDATYFSGVKLLRLDAVSADSGPEGTFAFAVQMTRQAAAQETSPTAHGAPPASVPAAADESFGTTVATLIAVLFGAGAVFWINRLWRRRRTRLGATPSNGEAGWWSLLSRVDYADYEHWPLAVRLFFLAEILLLAFAASCWIALVPEVDALREQAQVEIKLKDDFVTKTRQAATSALYSQQLKEVEQGFAARLKLLPRSFDDASLLIELNQSALGRGLTVRSLHPHGEVNIGDAYAAESWTVQLTGDFNDMGAFLADIAQLGRLVAFPKYRLSSAPKGDSGLRFEATLETYRELSADEVQQQKRVTQKSARKELA